MARGRLDWGHVAVVGGLTVGTTAAAQAMADRVPSSVSNKAAEVNKRTLIVAGTAGGLGIGGLLLGLFGGQRWAERVGEGLLLGASALGGQLGMAEVDNLMGIKDPGVSPTGFQPPVPQPPVTDVSAPPTPPVSGPPMPRRLATGANWTNAI